MHFVAKVPPNASSLAIFANTNISTLFCCSIILTSSNAPCSPLMFWCNSFNTLLEHKSFRQDLLQFGPGFVSIPPRMSSISRQTLSLEDLNLKVLLNSDEKH